MDKATATAILRRFVDPRLTVTALRPLSGGMVNTVLEFATDGEPASVVAKASEDPRHGGFRRECDSLEWFRRHTTLPVPRPYACIDGGPEPAGKCLLMERVPGRNLAEARLTREGRRHFQAELARFIADLHEHRRDTYGSALEAGTCARWLDAFGPGIEDEFLAVRERLSPRARDGVARLLNHLDEWLPESGEPTLVHGDLWATNIMVDDADPDRPRITAFLDGAADFREVESELAYLRVFHTADAAFFEHYGRRHPLREGFDRRCRVYWLNTMMLHVRHFGAEYLPACEDLARQIELMG
jgi:fructosamine-3-kinase